MKITDIFEKKSKTFSFEFFPPKTEKGMENLLKALRTLESLRPDFASITYGAMGTTREKTISISHTIQQTLNLTVMAHLTCVGSTKEEINHILYQLSKLKIVNIMALRGDPPKGKNSFVSTPGGFHHATDLIAHIKKHGAFCVGAAGYPEGHIEAKNWQEDMDYLKIKMDQGADFIITQLFLDNSYYYRFCEFAEKQKITIRLIPGIMPITNYQQIATFSEMCGCSIPPELNARLYQAKDEPEEVIRIGIDYALSQCIDLLDNGAPGLHFYTLNKSRSTQEVFKSLQNNGYAS